MQKKKHSYLRFTAALAWTLAAASAPGQECSNADFAGRYAVSTESFDSTGNRVGSNVGSLVADGNGTITEWKQTSVGVDASGGAPIVVHYDFGAMVAAAGNTMVYSVESDCRVMISGDFGAFELQGAAAVASGGKELAFQQTTSPIGILAFGTFRSVKPIAADQIAPIKTLLDRVAVRNGLRP